MLIRRTRTRDVRHRPSGNSSERLRVCGPESGSPKAGIPFRIGHVGEDAVVSKQGCVRLGWFDPCLP